MGLNFYRKRPARSGGHGRYPSTVSLDDRAAARARFGPPASPARINISSVLGGQRLGIKEVDEGIWLASFMHYDLGYFDLEHKTLQPLESLVHAVKFVRTGPSVVGRVSR